MKTGERSSANLKEEKVGSTSRSNSSDGSSEGNRPRELREKSKTPLVIGIFTAFIIIAVVGYAVTMQDPEFFYTNVKFNYHVFCPISSTKISRSFSRDLILSFGIDL